MLIAITSPIGIFNVSDVKPEFKSIDNFYFETLSNDSINDFRGHVLIDYL